jgi:hypothetical protein
MSTIVTITSDHANSIAGLILAAINKGLIDPTIGHKLRAALRASAESNEREFVQLIPAIGIAGGVVALCDDGNIFLTTSIQANPVVWINKGEAPQDPLPLSGVCILSALNVGALSIS